MKQVELKFNKESVSHNQRSNVLYGNLHFEIDGGAYPHEQWNDFVGRIVMTWAYSVTHHKSGVFAFFDGPYEVEYKIEKDEILFYLEMEYVGSCMLKIFLQALLDILEILLHYIKQNEVQTTDENGIIKSMQMVKKKLVKCK